MILRVFDADEFIWFLTDIYHKLGAEANEVHFSLNDIIRNLDNMKAKNVIVQCERDEAKADE